MNLIDVQSRRRHGSCHVEEGMEEAAKKKQSQQRKGVGGDG